jgi:hypothetical protein
MAGFLLAFLVLSRRVFCGTRYLFCSVLVGVRKISFWIERLRVRGKANALMVEYHKSVVGLTSHSRPVS